MTDTTDPLVKWDWEIAAAEAAYLADGGDESAMHCIADLAAEVHLLTTRLGDEQLKRLSLINECQALRKEHADAMSYFGSPPKYAADYGPTLLNQIQGLAGYYEEMMDEEEPDAALGRLVQGGAGMRHELLPCTQTCGEDELGDCPGVPTCPDYRPGAKCGDCALRVESGPFAGECHYDPDPRPENVACEFFEGRELLK